MPTSSVGVAHGAKIVGMPKFHRNAGLLAAELARAFARVGLSKTAVARQVRVSDETIRRWLALGQIPLVPDPEKLERFDKAANWERGTSQRILNDGPAAVPEPADFLEALTDILQAHLVAIDTGLTLNGEKVTGTESREQAEGIVTRAYDAAIERIRERNAVAPPDRHKPDETGNDAPRTPVPGGFRLSGI